MPDSNARAHQQMDAAAPEQLAAAPAEQPVYAHARNAIMDAAYDFRDAHISGCADKKRFAQAALECAVGQVMSTLTASRGQAPAGALEDAARLDWLEKCGTVAIERCKYLGSDDTVIEVTPYNGDSYEGDTLRAAIDAAIDAARKQGANHD